jgi:hypothetical protein
MSDPKSYLSVSAHRALEIAAICIVLSVLVCSGGRLGLALLDGGPIGFVLLALLLGYLLADFASGAVHWLADRYGTAETPVLGPNFIRPFRDHHVDPDALAGHSFIETNGNNSIASLPFMALFWPLLNAEADDGWPIMGLSLGFAFFSGMFITNQIHKWAHMKAPPGFVRLLQRYRLILSPNHHRRHHTPPFDSHYTITTGWLNAPLKALRIFEMVEWLLRHLIGLKTSDE